MDPLDAIQKLGTDGAWAGAALLLALSALLGVKGMTPVWAQRYEARTRWLTERDVKRGEEFVKKLNGRVYHDIARFLIADQTFRERFAPMHSIKTLEGEQQRIFAKIDEHAREDRAVHDRVRELEVRMDQVRDDVREIRIDLRAATETVTAEAKAMRQEQNDRERRIVEHIDKLFERRESQRG